MSLKEAFLGKDSRRRRTSSLAWIIAEILLIEFPECTLQDAFYYKMEGHFRHLTPGLNCCRKRERSGRWRQSAPGLALGAGLESNLYSDHRRQVCLRRRWSAGGTVSFFKTNSNYAPLLGQPLLAGRTLPSESSGQLRQPKFGQEHMKDHDMVLSLPDL